MKIVGFDIKRYDLGLVKPLVIKKKQLNQRSGVVIFLTGDSGLVGYGEITPLPGFHKESLDEVISQLARLKNKILNLEIFPELLDFNGELNELLCMNMFPSVRFGIETAIFNLFVQQNSNLINSKAELKVNGLVFGNDGDVVSEVDSLLKAGYSSIKIKVGKKTLKEDIATIQILQKRTADKALLRLDANRSWKLEEAITFGTQISSDGIEYIEEPTQNAEDHAEFFRKTQIPIALDETVAERGHNCIGDFQYIKALILKPGILGGFDKAAQLVRFAWKKNITPVVSSAFESSIGLKAIAMFAAKMDIANVPAGLDTLKWFAEDLAVNPLEIKNGKINIQHLLKFPCEQKILKWTR